MGYLDQEVKCNKCQKYFKRGDVYQGMCVSCGHTQATHRTGCRVEECNMDAEIEVERGDAILWLCGKHYQRFFGRKETPSQCDDCKTSTCDRCPFANI